MCYKNTEKQTFLEERKLLLRRSYQYDTTAIVGKTAEEETLIKELYEEAATQITRQFQWFYCIFLIPRLHHEIRLLGFIKHLKNPLRTIYVLHGDETFNSTRSF